MANRNLDDNYEISQWDPKTAYTQQSNDPPQTTPVAPAGTDRQNSQILFYDTNQPNDASGSWYDMTRQDETQWSTNTAPSSTTDWSQQGYENYGGNYQQSNVHTYGPNQSYNQRYDNQPKYNTSSYQDTRSKADTGNYQSSTSTSTNAPYDSGNYRRTTGGAATNTGGYQSHKASYGNYEQNRAPRYQAPRSSDYQQTRDFQPKSKNIHNNPFMVDDDVVDETEENLVAQMERQNLNLQNLPQTRIVLAKSALSKLEKDLDQAGEMFKSPELLKLARHTALGFTDSSSEEGVLDEALKSLAESSSLSAFASSFTPKPKETNDYAVGMIAEFVNAVSFDPGEFHVQSSEIIDYFKSQKFSKTDISKMVSTLMSKAIAEENFKYAGAKFCNSLCQLSNMGKQFRGELLQTLQKKYKSVKELISESTTEWKEINDFIMLLAEMYVHLQINNEPVNVLGKYLVQILLKLLTTDLENNFYFVVKAMKLTGGLLDSNDGTKAELNSLYSQLDDTWKSGTETEFLKKNQYVYDNIINLRGVNWGRRPSTYEAKSDITNQPETNDNFYMNEVVYFTADGKPYTYADEEFRKDREDDDFTPHENEFNPDEYLTEDQELFEENLDEYDVDYETFLKESGQN